MNQHTNVLQRTTFVYVYTLYGHISGIYIVCTCMYIHDILYIGFMTEGGGGGYPSPPPSSTCVAKDRQYMYIKNCNRTFLLHSLAPLLLINSSCTTLVYIPFRVSIDKTCIHRKNVYIC